jgi:gamma-glutamyltranspeptidase/glutathione hydrolase/leukotriene-C4 hydrolase
MESPSNQWETVLEKINNVTGIYLRPSVQLAKHGWKVDKILAHQIHDFSKYLLNDTAFISVFAPDGKLLEEGDTIFRVNYSETYILTFNYLRLLSIANDGISPFYNGWIGNSLLKFMKEKGGIITQADFDNYEVKMREPLSIDYKGMKIISTPPPTSGAVLLAILGILENYPSFDNSSLNIHRMVI